MSPAPDVQALVRQLRADGCELTTDRPSVWAFGDGPALASELASLVLQGRKTATAGLLWAHEAEGDRVPAPGDVSIVTDWDGRPLAVLETTEVRIVPFEAVDAEHARAEGEGDLSLEDWRRGHWDFFQRECARLGRQPSWRMPVVCERFRLLHRVGQSAGGNA
jgi:uncharacterized protein YhfF